MRTWVTCRLARGSGKAGFTLLELLVVMTLLAAMTGLAVPRMYALYEAGQRSFERDRVLDELASLPLLAYRRGEGFSLRELPSEESELPVSMPAGWALRSVDKPILYARTGVCLGGRVDLYDGLSTQRYLLLSPHCQPQ